ncbi:GMC oxidoreductase [Saccharata proteae CBS 121410]|uniref:GMC oxidoreductase n=1 Tax=Saccharata proteae CBS 121410 TaxID=1314787 RepID=A0A9P4I1U2_9PEZI|nr:GMC oxidoreductase [Saccharata proteae CBS 121410]
MLSALLVPALAASALAAPSSRSSAKEFDYIVVGGGTSGLVVANRLSELPHTSVLVIEAGAAESFTNTNVSSVAGYGLAFGTDIDYAYPTENQTYANGDAVTVRAGKAIGGTSTINGMAYTRAENIQIDAWAALGNEGWTWDNLLPYYKKSESFETPNSAQTLAGATYNPAAHGEHGPLKVGWTASLLTSNLLSILKKTYANLGIPSIMDVNDGTMRGFNVYPKTVDTEANVREDAARAYYFPYANRSNLALMQNTVANRIIWSNDTLCLEAVAAGVEITTSSGEIEVIKAAKEVIVSAGAIRSPGFLEHSGVGNPEILSKFDIPVKVNLPTVGENLQDQANNGITYSGKANYTGTAGYVAYPNVTDVFGADLDAIAASVSANLQSYANKVAIASGNVTRAADLYEFFSLQYDLIFTGQIPIAEVLTEPSGFTYDTEYWTLLPFSRGNVHISSSEPASYPSINPNFFMLDWDVQGQVAVAKFIRDTHTTAPFSSIVDTETKPGFDTVAKNATVNEWADWLKDTYRSNFHPVATAAMMPQEKGGVVDHKLKVYGTKNVRVVDASVLPFQVCGHLVSTLYAVAERASDLIKMDA